MPTSAAIRGLPHRLPSPSPWQPVAEAHEGPTPLSYSFTPCHSTRDEDGGYTNANLVASETMRSSRRHDRVHSGRGTPV